MPLPASAFSRCLAKQQEDPFEDWETAYSRDEAVSTEAAKNARLWADAYGSLFPSSFPSAERLTLYSNTVTPTYSILSSPSSSTSTSRAPPSAALDASTTNGPPQLKILKRPQTSSPAPSFGSRSRTASQEGRARSEKTLAEREKEYQEARRRIYGKEAAAPAAELGTADGNGKGISGPEAGMAKLSLLPEQNLAGSRGNPAAAPSISRTRLARASPAPDAAGASAIIMEAGSALQQEEVRRRSRAGGVRMFEDEGDEMESDRGKGQRAT
ncbi:SPOSA6832_01804 [Sporobolomyces salmonicolor]|uniref:SPOSA6832_01804-mRNA-1:cds n=1 Tax=Sporidiobolus salmonicolor TaxID=5005 RepID=A0A0D6EJS7_SPOSA|nr:SPOSA6832_01804 [Sporobolomyces salmonicolor]